MSAADRWDAIEAPAASASLSAADRWDSVKAPSEQQAKPDANALGSDIQNFFAGAGKAVVDAGRSTKQLMDIPAKWLEEKFPGVSQWSQERLGMPSAANSSKATNADVEESRRTDAPLMDTKAGIGGNIAGNVATTMLGLGGGAAASGSTALRSLVNPTTYKAAAASGAIQGALQPVTEGESRALNVATGAGAGVVGNAAVNAVGRIAQPVQTIVSGAHEKAVRVLESVGIPLDAAQRTGSTFLNKLRSSFSDNPFTAGSQAEFAAGQKALYNRAVLGTIGADGTAATPEVMNAAAKRIDGVFKDVLDRNSVSVNDSMLARLGQIQKSAVEEEKKPVSNIANRFIDAVRDDGTVPGQTAYNIKKDLDRLASSADTTLAYHARQLRSAVMDGVHASLNDTDRGAFDQARGQFANMKKIEGVIDDAGDISAPKLATVFRQKRNRAISIYGKGPQDLYDLAQAGSMLLPDRNPNSGSVGRAAMQLALPIVAGGAEGYREYDPNAGGDAISHGLMTAGAVAAGPRAAQFAMNSAGTAKYLESGIRGSMTPLRDLLLLPQNSDAVGGALRRTPEANRLTKRDSERP